MIRKILKERQNKARQEILYLAKKLSEGELDVSDVLSGEGQEKILANALNIVKSNLLYFVENTKKNTIILSNVINTVSDNMNVFNTNNEHMTNEIQEIAENTKTQFDLLNKTVSKVDEICKNIENIKNSVDNVKTVASNTINSSIQGTESLYHYDNNISKIITGMSETEDFMRVLKDSVDEISKVSSFILDISDQLKLLSLNALIESARAGAAGRGFSVVAGEITKLSEKTRNEIKKIDSQILSITNSSKRVEQSILNINEDLYSGEVIFKEIKSKFDNILEGNEIIEDQINNIMGQMLNIGNFTNETAEAIKEVQSMALSTTDSITEYAALSEEGQSSLEEIHASVGSLNQFVDKIKSQIYMFNSGIRPVDLGVHKKLKIAVITVKFGEFWDSIYQGSLYAKEELIKKDVTLDIIFVEGQDIIETFIETINKCIKEKYDGICIPVFSDDYVSNINTAVDQGIAVATYNTDFISESKRLVCVMQNPYNAGYIAGETMGKAIKAPGKILIVENASIKFDERVRGFKDSLKHRSDIMIVEDLILNINMDESYQAIRDYIDSNPDLVGMFVPGAKMKIPKAIEDAGVSGKVKLVMFDPDEEICSYIKKGVVTAAIGQNPFGQGHDPAVMLYNYLVTGIKPEKDIFYTRIDVIDKGNVDRILI
ncbi:MAG: substrate-binding domain-containing protein [Clostridiales bacterium]|nr:substrate-binding domain-containing protein [Clostridiales bacterium]